MNPLDPLDAAMMTAELVSNPMHVGAVLILSPPDDAGHDYVDELHREALAGNDSIDPRLRRYPHRGVDTGGMWVWRDMDTVDMTQHCQRRTVSGGEFWRLIGELDAVRLDRSGPMWVSYLIDGLDHGRFAFYIKVHHTVIDGVAGFQMITGALSSRSETSVDAALLCRLPRRVRAAADIGRAGVSSGRTATVAGWHRIVERRPDRTSGHRRDIDRAGHPGRAHDRAAFRGPLHPVQRSSRGPSVRSPRAAGPMIASRPCDRRPV